jgi:hypothetical protein
MALPTTITGVTVLERTAGKIGPFVSAAGDVYIVFRDSVSTGNLDIYKATDPTSSFSQVATLAVNPAASAQNIFAYAVIQNGNNLWIGTSHSQTSPGAHPILFHRFSMSSDTFDTSNEDTGGTGTSIDASKQLDISFRAAGPVIQYNGPSEAVMGQKQRAAYAERTLGSWIADIALDAGGEVNYFTGGLTRGLSEKLHFLFKDDANTLSRTTTTRLLTLPISSSTGLLFTTMAGRSGSQQPTRQRPTFRLQRSTMMECRGSKKR